MSKQNTASLPAAIILVEYLFIDRTWQGWKKKILWFTPIFILFVILVLYVSGFFSGAVQGRGLLEDVSDLMRETKLVSRWEYLCTQFNVLVIYIRLLFWPIRQNLYYNYPFKDGFFDDLTPFAFAFLAGLVVLSVWKRKKYPVFTVATFWFFITLSVESSIFPIKDAIFEHRLYLPMFGFALFVVWLFFLCLPKRRMLAVFICVSIVISMGTATYFRNRIWQNRVTLWTDVLAKSSQNPRAYLNLGSAFGSEKRYDVAIQCYNRVLKSYPDNVRANYNMGIMLEEQGDTDRAINYYRTALRIDPRKAKAHNKLGAILLGKGDTDGALKHLN